MTIKEISKHLQVLAPQLDGQDRMKLGLASKRSFPTITRYLAGEVTDLLSGEKILEEARKIAATKSKNAAKPKTGNKPAPDGISGNFLKTK